MKIGLCLSGGGAKGAYQAGVIKALYDKGIRFDVVAGTSIGAINGYYIYTNNVEKLSKMWINIEIKPENDIKIIDNTVDNSYIIEELVKLKNNSNNKVDFYVNYIEIYNKNVKEAIVNIDKCEYKEGLDSIKYSSLLPFNSNSTLSFKEQFIKDVTLGLYNGYKLDGGLVNNTLIGPLIEKNVDKIIIISTSKDYVLPNEIKNQYNVNNIIVIKPKTIFSKNDTLRFEKEFCRNLYNEGYDIGKSTQLNF